jgi:hypothetical protein
MITKPHILITTMLGAAWCASLSCATSETNEPPTALGASGDMSSSPMQMEAGSVMVGAPDSGTPADMTKQAWGSIVSVGPFASCVIDDQSAVHCFGRCGPSALGGSRDVAPAGLKARSVAVGNTTACALLVEPQDGAIVRCWGGSAAGATPKLTDTVEIVAGGDQTCARSEKGAVTCWAAASDAGANATPPSDLVATELAVSDAMDCAVGGDGAVRCWGPRPAMPPADLKAKRIAVSTQLADPIGGPRYGCAVTLDDSVRCWGDDPGGVQSVPAALKAKDIAVGRSAACALGLDGAVTCWGTQPRFGAPKPQTRKALSISMAFRTVGAVLDDHSFAFWGDVTDNRAAAPTGVRAP